MEAIGKYASAIIGFFETNHLKSSGASLASLGDRIGLVPIPPSMTPDSSDYDDRNGETCIEVCNQTALKFCRDIETAYPLVSAHAGGTRDASNLESALERVAYDSNECSLVFLVDDVLVAGAHFVAAKSLLLETGYSGQVFGLFYARAMY